MKYMKKGGRSFPDLNKDGKITMADILQGRGVIRGKRKKKRAAGGMYVPPGDQMGIGGALLTLGKNIAQGKGLGSGVLKGVGRAAVTPGSGIGAGAGLVGALAGKSKNPMIQKIGKGISGVGQIAGMVTGGGGAGGGILQKAGGLLKGATGGGGGVLQGLAGKLFSGKDGMKVSYGDGGKMSYGDGGSMMEERKPMLVIKMDEGGKNPKGLIDYRDYKADGSTALNTDTVDFLTQEMDSEEKELFMDMYSQGLVDYRAVKSLLRQEKPMNVSLFRKGVLKDPEGPATQANLTNEYGKLFGSGMKERRVKNRPLAGKQLRGRLVDVNVFYPTASRMDEDDILIPSGEKGEDIGPIEPLKATAIPIERREQDITMRMRELPERTEEIVEEQEVEDIPETLAPGPSQIDLGIPEPIYTDYTGGMETLATGPFQQQERLISEQMENQADGGRVYDKGGKMPPELLAYFLKKRKEKKRRMMMGGRNYRVVKR